MEAPSDTPPSDEKPLNPVSQVIQQTSDDRLDSEVAAGKQSSPTSVFVNSEPIREEQVQNAVKFLSHPKVSGSPVIYRRSFLERKGLTKEEIDEAFRRVPDSAPAVTVTQPSVTNQDRVSNDGSTESSFRPGIADGQVKSASNVPQQPLAQVLQPIPAGPVGSISKMGRLYRFHWSHALLAVGFMVASGAGTAVLFKNAIIPGLKSWICKVVLEEEEDGLLKKNNTKPSSGEEAAVAAAKSTAAATVDVARAIREMMITKNEEKEYFEELISVLHGQVIQMKSLTNAIQKLESGLSITERIAVGEGASLRVSGTNPQQPYAKGFTDPRSVRALSPSAFIEPSVAPHSKSYMEIMAMIQKGEKPSNIREINDAPPNPNQPLSNPRLVPRPKPWDITQFQNSSTNILPTQQINNGLSYEFAANQGAAVPWKQRENVRITEVKDGNELKFGFSVNERPAQQSWVPPLPPHVMMPGAAAAIRQQPKKPLLHQKEQMTDDQSQSSSSEYSSDELQRITKISESGGVVEANEGNSGLYSTEMQNDKNGSHMET